STNGPALLVLTDTYYPGWQAFVDGQPAPLLRGDVLFRVVPVPAGEHEVEFRFEPQSLRLGLLITACAAVLALGALVAAGLSLRRPVRN
ncbi:MAG TPA: YfhO family protein, partial [Dehalococcoidia bacterium]|nr:YfhO family protein [Dehalococcoidia bacterium]